METMSGSIGEEVYRSASILASNGKYAEAFSQLEKLSAPSCNHANVLYGKALCLSRMERQNEAIALCNALIEKHSDKRAVALKQQLLQSLKGEDQFDTTFDPATVEINVDWKAPAGAFLPPQTTRGERTERVGKGTAGLIPLAFAAVSLLLGAALIKESLSFATSHDKTIARTLLWAAFTILATLPYWGLLSLGIVRRWPAVAVFVCMCAFQGVFLIPVTSISVVFFAPTISIHPSGGLGLMLVMPTMMFALALLVAGLVSVVQFMLHRIVGVFMTQIAGVLCSFSAMPLTNTYVSWWRPEHGEVIVESASLGVLSVVLLFGLLCSIQIGGLAARRSCSVWFGYSTGDWD